MKSGIKSVKIFVNPHLYKVLRRDYDYDGVLKMGRRFHIIGHTYSPSWEKRMECQDDSWKEITIEGPDMNPHKAYFVTRSIESQFREKMNTYVLGQVTAGRAARTAVLEFLELYDILEEEIKLDSAYKDWRRFMATNKKRSRIPLWI